MAARRLGLTALTAAGPLFGSGGGATCGCGSARAFTAFAAAEAQAAGGGLLRRGGARPQLAWQPLPLLGGVRAFAKLPPHTELTMPSLSPTMNQVTAVSGSKLYSKGFRRGLPGFAHV